MALELRVATPHPATTTPSPTPCTENPDLFFDVEKEPEYVRDRRRAEAKAVCLTCPVRQKCLEWALSTGEDNGVWGGLDQDERFEHRNGRKRALARKREEKKRERANAAQAAYARGTIPMPELEHAQ